MKPVFQTVFGVNGNCMQAATAAFFELPLHAVPNFGEYSNAYERMRSFFSTFGVGLVEKSPSFIPRGLYFEVGKSTQGHEHIVLCRDGRIVHDPNPHGRGLVMRHFVLWPRMS